MPLNDGFPDCTLLLEPDYHSNIAYDVAMAWHLEMLNHKSKISRPAMANLITYRDNLCFFQL
jgi:hypothetical protein